MKKMIATALFAALAVLACTNEDIDRQDEVLASLDSGDVVMSVSDIVPGDVLTRTGALVDEEFGIRFKWSDDDKVSVYSEEGGLALFNLTSGSGSSNAVFNGAGFKLDEGKTYYAYYPYDGNRTDMTNMPLDYSSRKVTGDNNVSDILAYDPLVASAAADAASHATFNFSHVSSFARVTVTLPASEKYSSVDLIPTYDPMTTAISYNLKNGAVTPTSSAVVSNVTMENVSGNKISLWLPMAPQNLSDLAIVVNSTSGKKYTARLDGKNLLSGRAYKWNVEAKKYSDSESSSFKLSESVASTYSIKNDVPSGQYSGITKVSEGRYAVVHDKYKGGGILFFNMSFNVLGGLTVSSYDIPSGTSSATSSRDPEGIVYVPSSNTLFVSGEGDQKILEYDLDGNPTGRGLAVPADMGIGSITGNYGFEALGYNATTGLFWTTTENVLPKDSDYSFSSGKMLRLQSFGSDLQPDKRYFYMTDAPQYSASTADNYAFGVPDILALDDGRLIVMEREAYVALPITGVTIIKLYLVDPVNDKGGILSKSLLHSFTTNVLLAATWANYEGMCLGPVVGGKQTVLLVNDSQDRYMGVLSDYIKVLYIN